MSEYEFFSRDELYVFLLFCFLFIRFLRRWYLPLFRVWPEDRNFNAKIVLGLLPVVSFVMIYITLKFFASYDVVDSILYQLFYIIFGYAWLYIGLVIMSFCFGLIWPDDVIHLNNKAALAAIIGGVLSLTAIYAGANIGDGPGWWCVLFAGGLGLAAWIILGFVFHLFTGIFERITVDRDLGSGIRFCLYLVASGAILGYACSGDWTSFSKTVEEFMVCWPVLPLTGIMILVELFFKERAEHKRSV